MTIEELAEVVQHDFEIIRTEMVTHDELRSAESTIVRSIDTINVQLVSYTERSVEEFDRLSDRIASIENRLV